MENWQSHLFAYDEDVASYQAYSQQRKQAYQERQAVTEELAPLRSNSARMRRLPLQNKTLLEKAAMLQKFHEEMQTIKLSRLQQPSTLLAQQLTRTRNERDQLFAQASALAAARVRSPCRNQPLVEAMGSSAAHAAASRRIGGDVNTDLSQTSHTSRIAAAKHQIKQQQTQLQAQMQQLTEHKQRLN